MEFAEVEFLDAGFDFGAVADDHPDEVVGMHDGFCRGNDVGDGERADLPSVSFVVVIGQVVLHLIVDGSLEGV